MSGAEELLVHCSCVAHSIWYSIARPYRSAYEGPEEIRFKRPWNCLTCGTHGSFSLYSEEQYFDRPLDHRCGHARIRRRVCGLGIDVVMDTALHLDPHGVSPVLLVAHACTNGSARHDIDSAGDLARQQEGTGQRDQVQLQLGTLDGVELR